jgi:CheY-like chemotaxis protein
VADTGQGISAEFLPHVFERFRQAESGTTRVHGGLGLGLAISRELVELHGGTIRAESPGKGHGATFTVELPISHAPPPTTEAGPSSGPAKPEWRFVPSSVLKGIRALVVEDDPMSREVIRYLLEQCEAEVTALEDAAGALREFQANLHGRRFDVLLSDVGLPEKNGHELMREIRSLERQTGEAWSIPAVALTAYARDQDRTDALAAGFNAHVPKPVAASALVKTVARCLGRSVETPPAPSPLEPLKPSSGI